jgi:thymidylate synthase ThyX
MHNKREHIEIRMMVFITITFFLIDICPKVNKNLVYYAQSHYIFIQTFLENCILIIHKNEILYLKLFRYSFNKKIFC